MPVAPEAWYPSESPSEYPSSSSSPSRGREDARDARRSNRRRRYGSTRRDTPRPAYPPRAHSGALVTASTSSPPRASSSARVLASANARSPAEPYATVGTGAIGRACISPPPPYAYRKVASFEPSSSSNACRTTRGSFVERVRRDTNDEYFHEWHFRLFQSFGLHTNALDERVRRSVRAPTPTRRLRGRARLRREVQRDTDEG